MFLLIFLQLSKNMIWYQRKEFKESKYSVHVQSEQ